MVNDGAGRHSWADDVHADAALYAVDALDDDEARAFEAHLADCAMCQEEVDSFRGTGAELAGSLPVEPPPELRASVLAAVHEAGRAGVVPEAEDAAAAEAGRGAAARADRGGAPDAQRDVAAVSEAPAGRHPVDEGSPEDPVRRPATVHSLDARRTRRNRWILAAAAAAVVPGVALGGWALGQQSAQQDQQVIAQEQQRQERLLAAPDVEVQRVQMDGGAATVFASRDRDAALLVASDFPDPGEGKQYQLWLLEDGTPVPDVTFDGGQSDVWASGDLAGVQAMAVTVEPAGGSEHPTTDPLMVADL